MSSNILHTLLQQSQQRFLVLDGGMGTLLQEQFNCQFNTAQWSAVLNTTDKLDTVIQAHTIWLQQCHCNIIITNTYQAPVDTKLFTNGIQAAVIAAQQYKQNHNNAYICVAVSCGPYAALLADGSEYSGYKQTDTLYDTLYNYHNAKLQVIQQYRYSADMVGYDMIAFETIPTYIEITAILQLIQQYNNLQCYLTIACKSGTELNDSTNIDTVLNTICKQYQTCKINNLIGIGFNCTAPQYIESLIKRTVTIVQQYNIQLPIMVYPNAGKSWDATTKQWSSSNNNSIEQWCQYVEQWSAAGATVIGGCCQTTPKHIQATAQIAQSNK